MSGRWAIFWGDEGENEIELDQWDVVSMPVGIMRGFRNIGDSHANLMALLGGTDAGKVDWAESVLARAAETGLSLDAEGKLVERV